MTLEKLTILQNCLKKMRLSAMAIQLESLLDSTYVESHSTDQIIEDLIMAEAVVRNNRKMTRYLKEAGLRHNGAVYNNEMIRPGSGLSYETLQILKDQNWIGAGQNILITGPTGTGKSYLASAAGSHAVASFYTVSYKRTSLLLNEIHMAELNGSLTEAMDEILGIEVLILDDFGMKPMDLNACRSLFEILETREGKRPTIIVSQIPVSGWYDLFEDSRYADACMDRLLHHEIRIELTGDSLRERGTVSRTDAAPENGKRMEGGNA